MRKEISWSTITVKQFQEVLKISNTEGLDETDRAGKVVSILYEMTPEQIDDISVFEFNRMAKRCSEVMDSQIPGKPVRTVKPGRQRYKINYKVTDMKYGQYAEINHFCKNHIENLHFIMASIVTPVNWFGRAQEKNHKEVAEEMLNARLIDVYHTGVFFCKLFVSLMQNIRPYSIVEMMKIGITRELATALHDFSLNSLAGSIAQEKWQPLRV